METSSQWVAVLWDEKRKPLESVVTGDGLVTSPDVGEVNGDALGAPVWVPEVPVAPGAVVALWL